MDDPKRSLEKKDSAAGGVGVGAREGGAVVVLGAIGDGRGDETGTSVADRVGSGARKGRVGVVG